MPLIVSGSETVFEGKRKPTMNKVKGVPRPTERAQRVAEFAKETAMRRMVKHYRSIHG